MKIQTATFMATPLAAHHVGAAWAFRQAWAAAREAKAPAELLKTLRWQMRGWARAAVREVRRAHARREARIS